MYRKHKDVLLACLKAKVDLPTQTAEYFGSKYPDKSLLDDVLTIPLEKGRHYREYSREGEKGFEVLVNKLPQRTNIIRFTNSW